MEEVNDETEMLTPVLIRRNFCIADLKSGNNWSPTGDADASDSPTPVTLTSNSRKDLDFTEQLWTILKGTGVFYDN